MESPEATTSAADVLRSVADRLADDHGSFDRMHIMAAGAGEYQVRIYPTTEDVYDGYLVRVG